MHLFQRYADNPRLERFFILQLREFTVCGNVDFLQDVVRIVYHTHAVSHESLHCRSVALKQLLKLIHISASLHYIKTGFTYIDGILHRKVHFRKKNKLRKTLQSLSSDLPDKMRPLTFFCLRESEFFLTESDTFHEERHISGKNAHCLLSLFILVCFSGSASVYGVPILA